LRGELSAPEQESFERHYFECPRCFDELETYRALREGLEEVAEGSQSVSGPKAYRFDWRWAAAAAGVVMAIALGSRLPMTTTAPAGVSRSSPSPVAGAASEPAVPTRPVAEVPSLMALAAVQPPSYTPPTLRSVPDDSERRFREAMRLYAKGDFAAAKAGLEQAARGNPEASDIAFFLGVCSLLTDDTAAAVEQLRRTVALGDSPYLEEAHFYLAKAHLRRGELRAAEIELVRMIELRGDHEQQAQDLLQKVTVLRKGRLP
jgi:tetratricopeptide (TPR) repeat protein